MLLPVFNIFKKITTTNIRIISTNKLTDEMQKYYSYQNTCSKLNKIRSMKIKSISQHFQKYLKRNYKNIDQHGQTLTSSNKITFNR